MFRQRNNSKAATDLPLLHYTAFRPYICSYLKSGVQVKAPSSRTSKLDESAITSLSTDLFDELNRRQTNSKRFLKLEKVPGFSDRRNTARERLSNLSEEKFKSFISEIMKQLIRRNGHIVASYTNEYGNDDYVSLSDGDDDKLSILEEPVKSQEPAIPSRSRTPIKLSKDNYPSPPAPSPLQTFPPPPTTRTPRANRITPPSHELAMTPPRHAPPTQFQAPNPLKTYGAPKWDSGPDSGDVERVHELEREVEVISQDKKDLQEVIDRLKEEMETLREENYDMLESQNVLRDQIGILASENEVLKNDQVYLKPQANINSILKEQTASKVQNPMICILQPHQKKPTKESLIYIRLSPNLQSPKHTMISSVLNPSQNSQKVWKNSPQMRILPGGFLCSDP
jgi:hypothetical protein